MTYVEWLRVRNVLRVVAIVLGVLILVALVLRISFNSALQSDEAFIKHVQMQPGTTISKSVLPDGTKRTTIHDPKEDTTVTIDNHGFAGRHIVIDEPQSRHSSHNDNVTIGSIRVLETQRADRKITSIDTDSSTPFIYYMALADLVAFLIATLLAAPFARENDGHLEIALLKPVSREAFAINMMLVDFGGIIAASLMTVVAFVICQSMFEIPQFDFRGVSTQAIIMGIAGPLAWYAFLAAITTSMKRGYGAVLGFAWPVCILVTVFGLISWGDSLLGQAVHNIFWLISRVDPLSYISLSINENRATGELVGPANFGIRLAIEFALFIIYTALAVVQWKRVEA